MVKPHTLHQDANTLAPHIEPGSIELITAHASAHKRVITIMQSLQQLKAKVKSFFRHPIIKYTEMFADLCTG